MGDSKNIENEEKMTSAFDIESELSTLVEKSIIPSRIAEKLGQKLKEKNVKITKDQLYDLVEKIKSIMRTYGKFEQKEKTAPAAPTATIKKPIEIKPDANMQNLVETIEKIGIKLGDLEKKLTGEEQYDKKDLPGLVTTEGIKIPGEKEYTYWTLDPLVKISSNPESVVILMKWLQYLIDKCGRENLANILDYYVDVGWISQDAKISLIDYSHGITDENKKREGTIGKTINDLPSKDHIQSLIFIQKLKGRQFDKHFLERIDEEINRLTKKLDNYNFK